MKLTKFLLAFVLIAALGVSCDDNPTQDPIPSPSGVLTISATSNAIQSDGNDYCEFIVKSGETQVTEGVTIYMVENGASTALSSLRFTSTKVGTYNFFAAYGDDVSKQMSILVLETIPQLPADPQPTNTSFTRRVMALQMTGTGCPWCPLMINSIRELLKTADAEKVLFTGVHAYNPEDPMFTATTSAIAQAYGTGSFPLVTVNMRKDKPSQAGGYNDPALTMAGLLKVINKEYDLDVKAGVSASVEKSGNEIIITTGVKAAQAGSYRVGAWVLEDGIVAKQVSNVAGNYDTHENVVRDVSGRSADYIFTGDLLGDLAAGESKKHVLTIPVSSKWKLENCKVIVFVSTPDEAGAKSYYVNNSILCEIDATAGYTYK